MVLKMSRPAITRADVSCGVSAERETEREGTKRMFDLISSTTGASEVDGGERKKVVAD